MNIECLWCGSVTKNGALFCNSGGKTRAPSNTGEGRKFTKSYCLNDFMTVLKLTQKLKIPFSKKEQEYVLNEPLIKEWYKALTFIPYKEDTTKLVVSRGIKNEVSGYA